MARSQSEVSDSATECVTTKNGNESGSDGAIDAEHEMIERVAVEKGFDKDDVVDKKRQLAIGDWRYFETTGRMLCVGRCAAKGVARGDGGGKEGW